MQELHISFLFDPDFPNFWNLENLPKNTILCLYRNFWKLLDF